MSNGTTNVGQSANLTVISYTMTVNEKGEISYTQEIDQGMLPYSFEPTELAAEFDRDGAITITLTLTQSKGKENKEGQVTSKRKGKEEDATR